ncbi:MAG TPA: FG-GAP-like repeat-containing protein [Candidatus Limnocylindrales bacterium]
MPIPVLGRLSRRGRAISAGVAVVAIVVAAGGYAFIQTQSGAGSGGTPKFVDETASAGINETYDGAATYSTGGGVAVFDCNGDGKPDIYMAGGTNPATLYRNDSSIGGALSFTAVHDPATDLTAVTGAYPIDIDSDGIPDLVVLRAGGNVVLRGLGGCRFEAENERWGIDGGNGLSIAFSATWEGTNSFPTLAVGHNLKLKPDGGVTLDCDTSWLFRPDASGTHYTTPTTLEPGYCSLSMLFSDWSGTGQRDLRVANDRNYYIGGQDQLWRIVQGQAPSLYTAADGWQSVQIEGMGIAGYDLTGTGRQDYFLTSQADCKLEELTGGPGRPEYQSVALAHGVTATRPGVGGDILPSTSWHPEFQDLNNDGLIDLLVTKGNPSMVPEYASHDPSDLFLGQPDGTFVDAAETAGIVTYDRGRGAAMADFNLDGQLDLVEMFYQAPARIWRNVGSGDAAHPMPMGHWLDIRLSQPAANTDAIGAWIEVQAGDKTFRRELTVGGGHASGELGWTHFGIGAATATQVRVKWPDGTVGPWMPATADSFLVVAKGATSVAPWQPSKP